MIYNWKLSAEEAFAKFKPLTAKEVEGLGPPANWKLDSSREYFQVNATKPDLESDGKYTHPPEGSVFVVGEKTYGFDFVFSCYRRGSLWDIRFVVHKLIKTEFAPQKSFGISFKS